MVLSIVQPTQSAPHTTPFRGSDWEEVFEDTESTVLLKTLIYGGDQEQMTSLTHKAVIEAKGGEATQKTDFHLEIASLATGAVMILGFTGPLFLDPDTGGQLTMSGDLKSRLNTVRRLPTKIIQQVDAEVWERNQDPFGRKRAAIDTSNESGPSSTES